MSAGERPAVGYRCNKCHRPMPGSGARDGACECRGLIEAAPAPTRQLNRLALACYNGACNLRGLVRSLNDSLGEIPPGRERESVDLKIILGQLSFLAGDSLGQSTEALEQFRRKNKLS